jgi:hypothetical protein
MAETINDITIEYKEGDQVLVKELNKEILTKGAWTTIMFEYQDWITKNNDYGPRKFSIRRYQKKEGSYRAKSKFNITNAEQAKKIIRILSKWVEAE